MPKKPEPPKNPNDMSDQELLAAVFGKQVAERIQKELLPEDNRLNPPPTPSS